jgi:alpha-beta hydrolase superfamily lysophospholipase
MTEVSQFGLTASDGEHIAVVDWPLPSDRQAKAAVVIVHGLGEHIWRYHHVAEQLNAWGYAVRGLDLYGHGESGGPRGGLPQSRRMLIDLADVVDETWRTYGDAVPIVLLGHSMGGLIAADFVHRQIRPVQCLVLSSPAFDGGFSAFQKLLLAVLPKVAPNLRVDNGVDAQYVCRDPLVVKAYLADKLVHRKICARLAQYVAQTGPQMIEAAARWQTPTLLMYAGKDRLVQPRGSKAFAERAKSHGADLRAHCFSQMYHEILNDPDQAQVFALLAEWLDGRFSPARKG